MSRMLNRQRGNLLVGLVIGIVIGLGAALAVAVYVTKVPVPFVNKDPGRTAEQDAAESKKNQNWDPNAPLYGKNPARPPAPAPAPAAAPSRIRAAAAGGGRQAGAGDLRIGRPAGRSGRGARRQSGGRSLPVLHPGRRLPHRRGRRGAARQAVADGHRGAGHRARAVRPPGVPGARRPLRSQGRRRRSKEKLEAVGLETALVRVQR